MNHVLIHHNLHILLNIVNHYRYNDPLLRITLGWCQTPSILILDGLLTLSWRITCTKVCCRMCSINTELIIHIESSWWVRLVNNQLNVYLCIALGYQSNHLTTYHYFPIESFNTMIILTILTLLVVRLILRLWMLLE